MKLRSLLFAVVLLSLGCATVRDKIGEWVLDPGNPPGTMASPPPVEPSAPPSADPGPAPSPSPTAGPVPTPSATPGPAPTPTPPPIFEPVCDGPSDCDCYRERTGGSLVPYSWAPCPPAPPCVPGPSGPLCVDGCVSCSAWMRWALDTHEVTRCEDAPKGFGACKKGLVYNDRGGDPSKRDCFDPANCWLVWCDGSGVRSKKRLLEKEVCAPDCNKVAPTPCPPSPPPSAPPSIPPPPPPSAPPLTESGNLPMDYLRSLCAAGFSPTVEVGISKLSSRACVCTNDEVREGKCRDKNDCWLMNLHATEKSVKPYCEHSCYDEEGRYALGNCRLRCETLRECQQPEFVSTTHAGIRIDIFGPQVERGPCDKRTADCPLHDCRKNFICHDRMMNRDSATTAEACMEDGTKCGPTFNYRMGQ